MAGGVPNLRMPLGAVPRYVCEHSTPEARPVEWVPVEAEWRANERNRGWI